MPLGSLLASVSISAMASRYFCTAKLHRDLQMATHCALRRGEPYIQREVTKAENGTISPLALRTYMLLMSLGSIRKWASA